MSLRPAQVRKQPCFCWFEFFRRCSETLIQPESEGLRVLEIGAGNGSFARSLLEQLQCQDGIRIETYTSSSPRSERLETVLKTQAKDNELKLQVCYGVDVELSDSFLSAMLGEGKFDVIVFNNPLSHRYQKGQGRTTARTFNHKLLCQFLRVADHLLQPNGVSVVTLAREGQVTNWNIQAAAAQAGFTITLRPVDILRTQNTVDWRGTWALYGRRPVACEMYRQCGTSQPDAISRTARRPPLGPRRSSSRSPQRQRQQPRRSHGDGVEASQNARAQWCLHFRVAPSGRKRACSEKAETRGATSETAALLPEAP